MAEDTKNVMTEYGKNGVTEDLRKQIISKDNFDEDVKDHVNTDAVNNIKSSEYISLVHRFKKDKTWRLSVITWLCLCLSFHLLGWNLSLGGPALLDLKTIAKCSLQEASMFFTAGSTGYFVASFVISITFDRFNRILHIVLGHVGLAVVMAVIPWCSVYGSMLTMQFVKGFLCGICDIGSSTLLIQLMGKDVKTYMHVLYFSYTLGGILAPTAAAPFLIDIKETVYSNDSFENNSNLQLKSNVFAKNESIENIYTSEVFKAYSIAAGLNLFVSVPLLVMFLRSNDKTSSSDKKKDNIKHSELPQRLLVPTIFTFVAIWFVAFTIEDTITSFTATYAVKHFHWTTETASYVTAVFWTSFSVGSFSAIFISNFFSCSKLLLVYCTAVMLTSISLVVTSIYKIDVGLWIFVGICGFCLSLNYPLLLSWIEEGFFHVTAKANAALTVSSSTGVIISPIIVGALMELSPLYFSYFIFGVAICFFLLLSIAKLLSVKVKAYRFVNAETIVIEPDSKNNVEVSLL